MFSARDDRPALDRAIEVARGLRSGSWEAVESWAIIALASQDPAHLDVARSAAAGLRSGSWQSARALAWVARAERELSGRQ